jgi:hypothetical protein
MRALMRRRMWRLIQLEAAARCGAEGEHANRREGWRRVLLPQLVCPAGRGDDIVVLVRAL